MRGNAAQAKPFGAAKGSIPALAGERAELQYRVAVLKVYPRACGGTIRTDDGSDYTSGLSPRLRGNGTEASRAPVTRGSIPALAGERIGDVVHAEYLGVYPRACGGTWYCRRAERARQGLSPRLQGNGRGRSRQITVTGSIPALAGERVAESQRLFKGKVYPRACGGTTRAADTLRNLMGLSPRLRGNGSHRKKKPFIERVYPRACGGTSLPFKPYCQTAGLSPRLRGNGQPIYRCVRRQRSIPALAGERAGILQGSNGLLVYPRACGGTQPAITCIAD